MAPRGPLPLLGKRFFGWLSWQLRRRHAHRPEVLEALLEDLARSRPDHVVVTGDLTNVSLPEEFERARGWLERLGEPERVTAVPGNHDAYVALPEERSWAHWSEYLASDVPGRELLTRVCELEPEDFEPPEKPETIAFPSLRLAPGVALVGLCSALPTPVFQASGSLGREQLERLEALLRALGETGRFRVVLLHHPPGVGVVSSRRALRDAASLCAVLERSGAELVLHGHLHRTRIDSLPGPGGEIPVVGVRSASHADPHSEKLASYHTYEIETTGGSGPNGASRVTLRERHYDPATGAFRDAGPAAGLPLPAATAGAARG